MCGGPRMASTARTRSPARRSGPFGSCGGRTCKAGTCSIPNVGGPVTRDWFLKMVRRTGELAKLPFPIHPHMLRHACGFKLANDGVDTRALQHFMGHRNIQHTVRYTEMAPDRFKDFWG